MFHVHDCVIGRRFQPLIRHHISIHQRCINYDCIYRIYVPFVLLDYRMRHEPMDHHLYHHQLHCHNCRIEPYGIVAYVLQYHLLHYTWHPLRHSLLETNQSMYHLVYVVPWLMERHIPGRSANLNRCILLILSYIRQR